MEILEARKDRTGELIKLGRLTENNEIADLAKLGINTLCDEIDKKESDICRVDQRLVDEFICDIDEKIGEYIDQILHQESFQSKESLWRSLYNLVKTTNFDENIEIGILNITKNDLIEDFKENIDITQSGLYKKVYSEEYGQFGGAPYAAIIYDYEFTPMSRDIELLKNISVVASLSHCPFIASASPQMLGLDSYEQISAIKDVASIFDSPQHTAWRGLREREESRYIALTLPRFLLREPYTTENNPINEFSYNEFIGGKQGNYLWGSAAYLLAGRIIDSFSKYRWCPNIVGPLGGGTIEDLPSHYFTRYGDWQVRIPVEVLISDRLEYELSEQGFIPLIMRKSSNEAAFFSACSIQKPKKFGNSHFAKSMEENYKLGSQLPYLFIVTRLAHYIKVLQRENIGTWKSKPDIVKELNDWVRQYVSDQENPPTIVRCKKPLRAATIEVDQPEGEPGWYNVKLEIVPHFKYMGANFTLTLKGRLDR